MMRLRTLGSALAAVAFATVCAVAVPSAAIGAEPLPPVVDAIPDLPSRTVKAIGTGSPVGDEAAVKAWQVWRAMRDGLTAAPTAPPVKPITTTATLARSGGAVGGVFVGFQVGWGIGSAGLAAYGYAKDALTGSTGTYEGMICSTPGWYQAANDFLTMGISPSCTGAVVEPTPGFVFTGGIAAYQDWRAAFHAIYGPNVNNIYTSCWLITGTQPTGTQRVAVRPPGATSSGGGLGCVDNSLYLGVNMVGGGGAPGWIELRDTATGATVARTSDVVQKPAAEAVRKPGCTIQWRDGTSSTGEGVEYTESTGVPVSAAGLGCKNAWDAKPGAGPGGVMPSKISTHSTDESGAVTEIATNDVPEFGPTELDALGAATNRGLVLEKVVDGVADSCMTWAADCAGWWTQTASGTQPTTGTATYVCTYAGLSVALVECGPYRNTFDTKTATPTITDPSTGTEQQWSSTASPSGSTNPGAGLDPSGECFADGWSSVQNPIDWVLLPVKCALVWAFVPRQTVVDTALNGVTTAWDAKPPGQIIAAVEGWAPTLEAAGCSITVEIFSGEFRNPITPVDACEGSWVSSVTPISRLVVNVGMIVMIVVVLKRQIAGMVNYGPGQ